MIIATPFNIAMQFIMAFCATIGFSVLFNVTKKELVYSGLSGALGWLCNIIVIMFFPAAIVAATFLGAMGVTATSRFLSYKRKMPVSVYMIAGIIPLVPGAGIYYTMYEMIINGQNSSAVIKGVQTLKLAGVISVGILVVLSLPRNIFDWKSSKITADNNNYS